MSQRRLKYSDFWDRINIDSFEEAIEWAPEYQDGENDVGFCVFPENHSHGDTTGKFAIHREMRVYNCWACGGGSLLSLTMELLDMSISEATEWLYQFCEEDSRSDHEFVDEFLDSFRTVEKRVDALPYFNERVLEKFDEPVPEDWMESRGIHQSVIDHYGVRYSSRMFRGAPKKAKYADADDYEGPAIIFPHYHENKLVGWQSRWLDDERPEWVPKYTMTSDFPKENTLYGWNNLHPRSNPTFVVESVPSVLFLASLGFSAVATFGSSVNEAQMKLLRSLPSGVILAPDNDPAGIKWESTLVEYLTRYIRVWTLPLPGGDLGKDIGDCASEDDPLGSVSSLLDCIMEAGIGL